MLFRYDFNSDLDLSKFVKQTPYYIQNNSNIEYDLFVHDYKLSLKVSKSDDLKYMAKIEIYSLIRDEMNQITSSEKIIPSLDVRFASLKQINQFFQPNECTGILYSDSSQSMTDVFCKIIKVLIKLNMLRAFY